MANFRSIYFIQLLLTIIIEFSHALYEDQIGKFDWKRSYIGKVKYVNFEAKRIIVATEENVLASLNLKNGNIQWRQILENPKEEQIQLLHVDKDIFTVSGCTNKWFVRSWEINTGTLLFEWTFSAESVLASEFIISNDNLVHIAPVSNSHLKVTNYQLSSGEKRKATNIPYPWTRNSSSCIIAGTYYVCLSSEDSLSHLYYVNLLNEERNVNMKSLQSLIGEGSGKILLIRFKDRRPSVLLIRNNIAKLVILDENNVEIKPFDLMSNAVSIEGKESTVIYQLEASDNPDKLIRVQLKNHQTGLDEFSVDLEYPVGLGAPIILEGQSKGSVTDLLLSTSDNALLLVRLPEGKILWTREEALSNIVATEFFELPVSELDASIEREFDLSNDVLKMFIHRVTTQIKQVYNLIFGGQLLADSGLVRDEFGLHKIIVVATSAGKLFAIDTLSGSIAWSYRLPNVKPFKTENMYLFVQRTARYAPLPAQATLLAKDAVTGNGVLFQFNPITGYSESGINRLDYPIKQAMLMPQANENYLKSFIVLSEKNEAHIYPNDAIKSIGEHFSTTYMYTIDTNTGYLTGYNFKFSTDSALKVHPVWEVRLFPSKLVASSVKPSNERVHSQGRVLYDRSVYYKYVNPNLLALATVSEDPVHKHVLSIYLVDGVTGLILYSTSHKRAKGPVYLVHSENWLVYSYFNERFRRMEIAAAELYEGHIQSNSTVFSSHAVSQLPHVQTQSYILPSHLLQMAVTLTERGITNKFILITLSNGWVVEIPWLLLQPRFADIPCGPEESCIPYMPEIPLPPEAVINYNQTLGRIKGVEVAPARLESTSHILVHGLDIFYTRVAPSKTFDVLKEDFDHRLIVLVLSGLIIASYVTKHLASRKALKQAWK